MRISSGRNPSGLVALKVAGYQLGQTEYANLLQWIAVTLRGNKRDGMRRIRCLSPGGQKAVKFFRKATCQPYSITFLQKEL